MGWVQWGLWVAATLDREHRKGGQPGGSGSSESSGSSGNTGMSGSSIKASVLGEKRQGGGQPGEPCRCDKLKISTVAHGDAPRRLCCRRGFLSLLADAAVTTCGTLLTRPPASLEQHSQCPCHGTQPVVAPQAPSLPRQPLLALPAIPAH